MKTFLTACFVLIAASASAQLRPGAFTTVNTTDTSAASVCAGCPIGTTTPAANSGITAATVSLSDGAPSVTTNKVYQVAGRLFFNGVSLIAGSSVTVTTTGTVDNWAPGLNGNTVILCNNATLLTIDGIAGGFDGQVVQLISIGAGEVDLFHQSGGSTAANRFINYTTSSFTSLAAGVGTATYRYDASALRWRLMTHEQGAWITRNFTALNYTATSGNWNVAAAIRDAYWLKGRTLLYSFNVTGTTTATPTSVRITLPFQAASVDLASYYIANNGAAASETGFAVSAAANTALSLSRPAGASFAAGTVTVGGQIAVEVN